MEHEFRCLSVVKFEFPRKEWSHGVFDISCNWMDIGLAFKVSQVKSEVAQLFCLLVRQSVLVICSIELLAAKRRLAGNPSKQPSCSL
mmetsp:Transcript_79679/g.125678  ORF Transcript_79679/g.125678 Transcript_79679/m.125678 type:complete len:87 (-) Transcript_79679:190-450(-)